MQRKWQVRWAEDLPCATGIYLRRWVLEAPWWSLRLHHWFRGDDARAPHDHPWAFWVLVLKGGYLDQSPEGDSPIRPRRPVFWPALHQHTVVLPIGKDSWSLVLTGPQMRKWGFWVDGKWKRSVKWFYERGPHPCQT